MVLIEIYQELTGCIRKYLERVKKCSALNFLARPLGVWQLFVFVFLFANTSPHNHICICICPFLSTQINSFFPFFQPKFGRIYICPFLSTQIYLYLSKKNIKGRVQKKIQNLNFLQNEGDSTPKFTFQIVYRQWKEASKWISLKQ